MKPVRARRPDEIPDYVDEYVRTIREQTQFKKNRWCHDAWETIMEALEEESESMRAGGPCSVRIYERLVELAFAYLKAKPNIANVAELRGTIEADVEVLGLRMLVLKLQTKYENIRNPYSRKQQQILDVALIHLLFQAKLLDKQLMDTS